MSQRQLYLCFLQLSGDVPVSHFGGGTPTRMRGMHESHGRRCGISAGPAIGQRKPAPAALAWAAEYRDKFAEPLPAAAAAASVITPSETWLGAT